MLDEHLRSLKIVELPVYERCLLLLSSVLENPQQTPRLLQALLHSLMRSISALLVRMVFRKSRSGPMQLLKTMESIWNASCILMVLALLKYAFITGLIQAPRIPQLIKHSLKPPVLCPRDYDQLLRLEKYPYRIVCDTKHPSGKWY